MGEKSNSKRYSLVLSRIEHRGERRILLSFPYDKFLIAIIKTVEGRRYSNTYKSWYLPYKYDSLVALQNLNILASIKQEYQKDPLFQRFELEYREISIPTKKDGSLDRRIHFLVESFSVANRSLMKNYISYLTSEGYSWNSIIVFSKYAAKYINGDLKGFILSKEIILESEVYDSILETFLEFRKSV